MINLSGHTAPTQVLCTFGTYCHRLAHDGARAREGNRRKIGCEWRSQKCQTRSEKFYDRECRRRAAYWSEREGTHNTEAGKVGSVHEGAAAPYQLHDGNMASDKTSKGWRLRRQAVS